MMYKKLWGGHLILCIAGIYVMPFVASVVSGTENMAVLATIVVSLLYMVLGYLLNNEITYGNRPVIAIMSISIVLFTLTFFSSMIFGGVDYYSVFFNTPYFVTSFMLFESTVISFSNVKKLIILLTLLPSTFILVGYQIKNLVSRRMNS